MSVLEINGLSHIYDEKLLFDNAGISINNGEHIGIVGLNGAGKSTFMNIIAKKIPQDEGEIKWLPGIRWGYLDQHAEVESEISVMDFLRSAFKHLFDTNERLENIYAELSVETDEAKQSNLIDKSARLQEYLIESDFYDLDSKIKKVTNGLGINNYGYDTPLGNLSGGQRAKVMLAKLMLEDLDVMLLDEPTNFLDVEHVEWLIKFLENFKGTFLVVSHDTLFLNRICRGILNIENSEIKKYSGSYDQFMLTREQNAKQYEDRYLRQQKEIERMEIYIAKNKARAATAGMANSRKKMLDKIEVMKKPAVILDSDFSFPYIDLHTKDMLIVKNLQIGYEKPLLPPINFHMASDTKIWIRGTNGIGKSTLLKTLMGQQKSLGGSFHFHLATKIGYLEQDLIFGNKSLNAMIYFNECFPKLNNKDQRSALAKVGLKGDLATNPIEKLSGGEQVRIKIAVLMNTPSNILILDEPTNHLDIRAKDSLKKAISEYSGALILVTHEQDFAESVCNKTFDIT